VVILPSGSSRRKKKIKNKNQHGRLQHQIQTKKRREKQQDKSHPVLFIYIMLLEVEAKIFGWPCKSEASSYPAGGILLFCSCRCADRFFQSSFPIVSFFFFSLLGCVCPFFVVVCGSDVLFRLRSSLALAPGSERVRAKPPQCVAFLPQPTHPLRELYS
jgi:hypothetical protein